MNKVNFIDVESRQSFGRLNFKIPNIYKITSSTQWPGYTGDHTSTYEEYKFTLGQDTGLLTLAVPLELNVHCIPKD